MLNAVDTFLELVPNYKYTWVDLLKLWSGQKSSHAHLYETGVVDAA